MSVIYKLTLSLFILSLVVFGLYGSYQLRAESQHLKDNVEYETNLLGHSLLVAIENALRDQQIEDIQELLKEIENLTPSIDVRIYIQHHDVIRSNAESLIWSEAVQNNLKQSALNNEMKQFYYPEEHPDFLILSLPFQHSELRGNLAIVHSLQTMKQELNETRVYILVSFLSFIAFTSVLCFLLGHFYIARPLQHLRNAMRQFRNSFAPPELLTVKGKDEISLVIKEFNYMTSELFAAHQQLDIETQHRRQLQKALQEADKLITLGQLSAGLAHEIGSPLQILNGRARELLQKTDKPEQVSRIANIMVAQTDRITRIVQRLLEFTPRHTPEHSACDVVAAITEVIDMLDFDVRKRGIKIDFFYSDALPLLPLNKDSIQQIVLNLLTNALAAITASGAITIELTKSTIKTLPVLKLSVTDTGSGIAPEHLPLLFEPYFTTRNKKGGTGLGLAVVKTLVTDMGGQVELAQTELGRGSQFIVYLPWNKIS